MHCTAMPRLHCFRSRSLQSPAYLVAFVCRPLPGKVVAIAGVAYLVAVLLFILVNVPVQSLGIALEGLVTAAIVTAAWVMLLLLLTHRAIVGKWVSERYMWLEKRVNEWHLSRLAPWDRILMEECRASATAGLGW